MANELTIPTDIRSYHAGEPLAAGSLVMLAGDAKIYPADCTALSHQGFPMGVIVASAAANAPLPVYMSGTATYGSWNWTPGDWIYLSTETPGLLTNTIPTPSATTFPVQVGLALSATSIAVNPVTKIDIEGAAAVTVPDVSFWNASNTGAISNEVTGKMLGTGMTHTPTTANVLMIISGVASHSSTGASNIRLYYGTGSSPNHGDALTGTAAGPWIVAGAGEADSSWPFTIVQRITGQEPDTELWIDLAVKRTVAAGDVTVTSVQFYIEG